MKQKSNIKLNLKVLNNFSFIFLNIHRDKLIKEKKIIAFHKGEYLRNMLAAIIINSIDETFAAHLFGMVDVNSNIIITILEHTLT